MGRRDPPSRDALAVQARLRSGARRDGATARGGAGVPGWRDQALRASRRRADPRQAADAAYRPSPPRRAMPTLWRSPRGGVLRGLRDVLLPDLPDRWQSPQGPAAVEAAEVGLGAPSVAPQELCLADLDRDVAVVADGLPDDGTPGMPT